MSLTAAQYATLRAAVSSDASVSSFVAQQNWFSTALAYNQPTTTQIWRADITPVQIQGGIVASEAIAQSPQALQMAQLLLSAPLIDATKPNVRAQFAAIFPGSSAASTIANLTAIAQRNATKFENLYVSSAVSSVYGYVLSPADVQQAMS
jgi:hypothetical protein